MSECLNAKIVIVGDGAIGKTCVMIRFISLYPDTPKDISTQNTPQPSSKTKSNISISTVEPST